MKKQFLQLGLAVFVMILFASCSSDDDGVSISDESVKLRGTWELEIITQNNQNTFEIPCDVKRGFVFNQNFTYTETTFAGENPGNCSVAANFNGEWDNIEDGELRLRRAGQSSVETLNIVFIQNDQRFEVTESPNRRLTFRKVN
jgi:hypothetical protein